MKITIITLIWNEEVLLPLFLQHYGFADEIVVLLDSYSTDTSAEICRADTRCRVEVQPPSREGDVVDDGIMNSTVNAAIAGVHDGWIIVADADEFIFTNTEQSVREVLEASDSDIYTVTFMKMYRHVTEGELVHDLPAMHQRRHGVQIVKGRNRDINKPCVLRAGFGFALGAGSHSVIAAAKPYYMQQGTLFCAHWQMADVSIALSRRLKGRRDRLAQLNRENEWGLHNFDVTAEEIINDCIEHSECPQLF